MKENKYLLNNNRILVTGGAGVIGLQLIKILYEKGAKILSIDRYPISDNKFKGIIHLQSDLSRCDLNDIRKFNPNIIFHLSASFERSKESPEFFNKNWQDNVLTSHRIINVAKSIPELRLFVFASSYLVYSPELYLSRYISKNGMYLKEEDLKEPRNITGAAKLYTEKEIDFIKEYFNSQLRTIYARIYRVYGCGSNDIISRWIRDILRGKSIKVYNRENRFDFIFSSDVAQGLVKLAESSIAEGAVNLGTGKARSINEVLEILYKNLPNLNIEDEKYNELYEASSADLSKLKLLVNWVPSLNIEDAIPIVIEYEQKELLNKMKK